MTHDVLTFHPGRRINGTVPPAFQRQVSRALADAYNATLNPHPDIGPPTLYDAIAQAEARRWADEMEPLTQPVSERTLREWLAPIPAVVRNEKTPEAIAAWLAGVIMAVGHLEAGAFNAATQREALQTFKFFPSASDVYDVVSGPAVGIRQRYAVLRRIAAGGAP
ncbi:hypothetical protein UFOVP469_36 [uncultured Caudovirales phage]|uniref:Uncharacterized protein n=1 Tax=uncultured Caudovirales phage TaxID=2100421 RepID=A0A6J5MFF1_9CAUD|nr:hypothetical protein UFOVP469_36 [uncultured Caudovirales phage]CAB4189633.1 hypothetical protein UFOVP1200_9 [uncultured Caudovirales phage]